MATNTNIEWTRRPGTIGATLNPTTGCDRISDGCTNCYALTMAKRLQAMGQAKYQADGDPRTSGPGFGLTLHPDTLNDPFSWRKPRTVFVNSMSDLGHARVPRDFLAKVFAVMALTPQHTYQILSKRPKRVAQILGEPTFRRAVAEAAMEWAADPDLSWDYITGMGDAGWPVPGAWIGTSIELDKYTDRADWLRETPAAVRFVSAEPLLGPLPSLDLTGIDWLILGGESGPGSREVDLGWFRELIAMARTAGTAIFVKQMGSRWAADMSVGGQPLARTDKKGGDWRWWPDDLRIREYPKVKAQVGA